MHRRSLMYAMVVVTAWALPVAVNGDGFYLEWWTIAGGGEMWSAGGGFEVSGTIGQPNVGHLQGGDFTLEGGFWPGAGGSPPCPGDLDGDNDVDLSDLATLLAHYGEPAGMSYADGDLDGDGDVDLSDLATLLAVYGTTCD